MWAIQTVHYRRARALLKEITARYRTRLERTGPENSVPCIVSRRVTGEVRVLGALRLPRPQPS